MCDELRQPFDTNLLYLSWYFVNNATDEITGINPWPDPLQSPFFQCLMKNYAEIIKKGQNYKKDWKWLRRYFIGSIFE